MFCFSQHQHSRNVFPLSIHSYTRKDFFHCSSWISQIEKRNIRGKKHFSIKDFLWLERDRTRMKTGRVFFFLEKKKWKKSSNLVVICGKEGKESWKLKGLIWRDKSQRSKLVLRRHHFFQTDFYRCIIKSYTFVLLKRFKIYWKVF